MNRTLFASWHAVAAGLMCLGFALWMFAIRATPGNRLFVGFQLWTGWVAFALMVIVCLYSLRKFIQRLGWSFELKNRAPLKKLERAEARLAEIRRDVMRGVLRSEKEVEDVAKRAIKEAGVASIVRVVVRAGEPGEAAYVIETRPTEPLGRVGKWMHVHIWYGLASGVLVWLHGGFSMVSILGVAMNVLTVLVIVSGVIGAILWALGPSWLVRRERDLSFEESYVLDRHLSAKLAAAYTDEKKGMEEDVVRLFRRAEQGRGDPAERISGALAMAIERQPDLAAHFRDIAALIGQRVRIRAGLAELSRIKFWMNVWRALHVPASILLMGIVVVHVISVWWY